MTQTSSLHLTQPTVGGDSGTWGGEINTDLTLIDRGVNGMVTVNIPDTNISLTADGSTSDTSLYAVYQFTGALTADRTVTLPSNYKIGIAINATSGGHNVILNAGGTTLAVSSDSWTRFFCDGSNVTRPDTGGSVTNDNAPAGAIGEYISSTVLIGSAVTLTSAASANVTSISLTPGDWDVSGNVFLHITSGFASNFQAWVNTTSATAPTSPGAGAKNVLVATGLELIDGASLITGATRISLASTTTVYLGTFAIFSNNPVTAYGFIGARRAR